MWPSIFVGSIALDHAQANVAHTSVRREASRRPARPTFGAYGAEQSPQDNKFDVTGCDIVLYAVGVDDEAVERQHVFTRTD